MTPKCPDCKRDQDKCVCVDLEAENAALKVENENLLAAGKFISFQADKYLKELDSLKEQVAQLEYDKAEMKKHRDQLAEYVQSLPVNANETIAQQAAHINRLREALDSCTPEGFCDFDDVSEALAIQPSPDILRERDARLVERVAEYVDRNLYSCREYAEQIRERDWK